MADSDRRKPKRQTQHANGLVFRASPAESAPHHLLFWSWLCWPRWAALLGLVRQPDCSTQPKFTQPIALTIRQQLSPGPLCQVTMGRCTLFIPRHPIRHPSATRHMRCCRLHHIQSQPQAGHRRMLSRNRPTSISSFPRLFFAMPRCSFTPAQSQPLIFRTAALQ